ncbi:MULTISPECIES: glutamate synthase [unclassified Clostridium]|uniref:GltB/FmdC/FwdC-like GXGXG domain-containing protein n=1 Tax=unclassified Clostridium TaxID=2614128 RepID=UPI0011071E4F|nr:MULTISPECIES: glutamate synthase [unclassified Clostridium]
MRIDASGMHFKDLNDQIRNCADASIQVENCVGQRYLAAAMGENKALEIHGTPGNALGAYLDGGCVTVYGNCQEATGNTMNAGTITVHGSCGDATGYAMRGGRIFVQGDAGYRAGIHMKAYEQKVPALVIGGRAGSFLGEYQAGGVIVVLGLGTQDPVPVGPFCGTGMHGGRIYIRCKTPPEGLPAQVAAHTARQEDKEELRPLLEAYCAAFDLDAEALMRDDYCLLTPNTQNPYRQLYTPN